MDSVYCVCVCVFSVAILTWEKCGTMNVTALGVTKYDFEFRITHSANGGLHASQAVLALGLSLFCETRIGPRVLTVF